jgi:FkbM family methyltransferase
MREGACGSGVMIDSLMTSFKKWRRRRRRQRIIRAHLKQHGEFYFRGYPVWVPEDVDLGIQALIANCGYEAAECKMVERYLPCHLPVIELGGCLGLVSSVVARNLEAGIAAIVVEANPTLLAACRHNATLGGQRAHTEIIPKAVAYSGGQVAFHVHDNAHISRLAGDTETGGKIVDAVTLSELVGLLEPSVQFSLICDIEGAEVELVTCDADALQRCALAIIEMHPGLYADHTVEELINLISAAGLDLVAQEQNVYAFQRLGIAT